jgi:hypothetical protein
MTQVITIEKEQIPSKSVSILLKEPTFGDWRTARKRYPYPSQNQPSPGYSVEELFFALCFVGVNGKEFDNEARDVVDRLANLSIEDKQFLLIAFMEGYFMSPTEAKEARQHAQNLVLGAPSLSYTLPKELLPSGEHSLTFTKPNTGTQMAADRSHQGPDVNGCSLEELLLAICVTHIDGVEVDRTVKKEPVAILDALPIPDVQVANLIFINMFTIDDAQTESAKTLGKLLGRRGGQTKPESKAKSTTRSASAVTQD